MKRTFFFTFFLSIVFLISCGDIRYAKPNINFDNYLDSLKKTNEGWQSNSILKKELNEIIKSDLKFAINKGILEKYPLIFKDVAECKGKYYAKFENYYYCKNYIPNGFTHVNFVEFDLICEIPKEIAITLKNDSVYSGEFKFIKYLDLSNSSEYCFIFYFREFKGIQNYLIEDVKIHNIQLGTVLVKTDTLLPYVIKVEN